MLRSRYGFLLMGFTAGLALSMLMRTLSITSEAAPGLEGLDERSWIWRLPDLSRASLASLHGGGGGWEEEKDPHLHHQAILEAGQDARLLRFDDQHAHDDDDTLAKKMALRVRVLVWVMTSPQNLDKKAVHVRNTWGKRANSLLFMSSEWNSTFPTIGLNVSEGRAHLTAKTMKAFRYIYQHHFDDADWFMKADDDTYVIMENLRYMLSSYSPQDPIYTGHMFKVIVKQGYASGGAGYVISKEALRRLGKEGLDQTAKCKPDGGSEDVEIGRCLMNLGIKTTSSLDQLGRSRFHCFQPEVHLHGHFPSWYLKYDANGAKNGMKSISDYPVTFHYIGPRKMYELEYFVYHLRPFGIISRPQALNRPKNGTLR